jgi:hypothetical protein
MSNLHLVLTNWLGSLGGLSGLGGLGGLGSLGSLCPFCGTGGFDSLGNLGILGGLGIRLAATLLSMKGLRLANVGFAVWRAAADAGRVASYPIFGRRQPFNLTVSLAPHGYS